MEVLHSARFDLKNFQHLSAVSKVWIYQADREFTASEIVDIRLLTEKFVRDWASHGTSLYAGGELFFGRFLVLMVDETMAGASGCSIDSSVKFVRYLEQHFQVGLFDRLNFAWIENDIVRTAPKPLFKQYYTSGTIDDATLVFDNLVQTKAQMEAEWLKPLGKSWHKRFV